MESFICRIDKNENAYRVAVMYVVELNKELVKKEIAISDHNYQKRLLNETLRYVDSGVKSKIDAGFGA